MWDALTDKQVQEFQGHITWATSLAFSSDGTQIVSGSNVNSVQVWDALTGKHVQEFQGHTNWVTSVAFSPDRMQIVSGSYDNSVWDALTAIPHWDGWREISEEDRYCLLFKRVDEIAAQIDIEGTGLYYYIGMDPNVGQLWKRTPAHGMMPVIGTAINVALTDSIMVDATAAEGPSTPPKDGIRAPTSCN
ncbi:hypothetical protein C0992_012669 [Termitomyces sp. T32_za158]|nr:hypothetical protein C0992_012669 [Termitomyces sp. T32_za158]